jgi:hypothetical protein
LDPVKTREDLDLFEKLTGWELLQSLASELVSPNIQINSSNAARDFAASTASAYRVSTRKTKIIDRKYGIHDLDHVLKHNRKLRMTRSRRSSMQYGSKGA